MSLKKANDGKCLGVVAFRTHFLFYYLAIRYAWQFGDPLNDNGMYDRCHRDHGYGNCEKDGLIVYPKCKKQNRRG